MNSGMKLYLDYTKNQESPILFHAFVATSLASATLARRVWVAPAPAGFEGVPIYPNMYIVLVGPSGRVFKSSAINWGEAIVRDLPNMTLMRDKLTPQYLLSQLSDTPEVYILAKELKTFIGTDSFINGLAAILTNLHDAPDVGEYRTKGAGVYQLIEPCLNILGGSTPEWLVTGTPADATSGGFSARFLYVVQKEATRVVAFPYKDASLLNQLIQLFYQIANTSGKIPLAPGVWEWYELWYAQLKEEVRDLEDERTLSYYGRKHTHLWKLAMALMALDGRFEFQIKDLEEANQMLKWLEQTLPLAFQCITYSESTRLNDRIVNELAAHEGRMSRSALLYSMLLYADATEVDRVISTLVQSHVIAREGSTGESTYVLLKPLEEVLHEGPTEEEVYGYFSR